MKSRASVVILFVEKIKFEQYLKVSTIVTVYPKQLTKLVVQSPSTSYNNYVSLLFLLICGVITFMILVMETQQSYNSQNLNQNVGDENKIKNLKSHKLHRVVPADKLEEKTGNSKSLSDYRTGFSFKKGFLSKSKDRISSTKTAGANSFLSLVDTRQSAIPIDVGNVSLTYRVVDVSSKEVGVFKPFGTLSSPLDHLTVSSKAQILNEVAAYKFDQLTSISSRANVPETKLVSLPKKMFNNDIVAGKKVVGSIQKFVHNTESCEDYGTAIYDVDQIHRVGILDLKILNCDRHTGNLLFDFKEKVLTPIDHALSFPTLCINNNLEEGEGLEKYKRLSNLAGVSFDWMLFPQSKEPFSVVTLNAIRQLDVISHIQVLKQMNIGIEQQLAVYCSLQVLKMGAVTYKKTLFELGSIVQRKGARTESSTLEQLIEKAMKRVDKTKLLKNEENAVTLFRLTFTSLLEDFLRL